MEIAAELVSLTTGFPSPFEYRSHLPASNLVSTLSSAPLQTTQKKDYRPLSTLHLTPRHELSWDERIVSRTLMSRDYHALRVDEGKGKERGEIPRHSTLREHLYILPRAMVPVVLQQTSYYIWPDYHWPLYLAYPVYFLTFAEFLLSCIRRFDYFANLYGTLDETHSGRDRIPDQSTFQLARAFLAFIFLRIAGEFVLKWDEKEMPLGGFGWTTPVRVFVWLIVMDYFFYIWHRSAHQVESLWQFHRQHHTTKHPSPALSILAEGYQEIVEILLVPLCATLLVPLSFHELFVTACYTSYVEILGHTGIRADWDSPLTGYILRPLGLNLVLEDHDLHHRYGKSGKNFGKQSRVWDVLFGTTGDREEMKGMKGHRAL